jgi:NAD(P)-dependent dehydrogenase (short-subunit alcohol dehydrogenase family)
VNNAGIWSQSRRLSSEGIEITWATNVLGYYLVTDLLLDALRAGAPSRVINVCSRIAHGLRLDDVELSQRRFRSLLAYAQSKQADLMLTWGWARRLESAGVTVNAVYPGRVATDIDRELTTFWGRLLRFGFRLGAVTPERGAETAIWLATTPDVAGQTGKVWKDRREARRRFDEPAQVELLLAQCRSMTLPSAPIGAQSEAALDGG